MVAEQASKGILLRNPANLRASTEPLASLWHFPAHDHEVYPPKYTYGSRLNSQEQNFDLITSAPLEEAVTQPEDFSDCTQTLGDPPNSTIKRQNSVSKTCTARQSLRGVSTSRRSSVGRKSSRASRNSIRRSRTSESQLCDLNVNEVISYTSTLIQQKIDNIKNEELVLDWSSPYEQETKRTQQRGNDTIYHKTVLSLNKYNERLGLPIEAFPPSLIKWPGPHVNKKKRLSEIKKQVKLLSSIIKMTIEGSYEQAQAGSVSGVPAPFTSFVNMNSIPATSLVGSSDELPLPSETELSEHLRLNKLKEAKSLLRHAGSSVTCSTRPSLWLHLCKRHSTEPFSDEFYYDTIQQIYGTKDLNDCHVVLPAFVDSCHLGRGVTSEGMAACGRVVSVLAYYYPPITQAPLLHPLASCLMLYMSEADVYNSLSALICSKKGNFVTQTKTAGEVAWRVTLTLARKHVGTGFSTMEKLGIQSKEVEAAFQNWLWWIFEGIPVPHMIRVVDCFLLEGCKVLVRVALAVFQLFIRQVSRDSSAAAALSTKGLPDAIFSFCQNLSVTPAKLLKTAFGIRALSMAEITKVMVRTEHLLKAQAETTGHSASVVRRTESLPSTNAQADALMLSHTLNVKEDSSAPRTHAVGDYPIRSLKTNIASLDELLTIWNWMPVRMTMHQPSLLYTTEEHGSSLTNFYQRVEHYEPTILLVRTTCDHVFGAYCSSSWVTRHKKDEFGHKQTYFGSGESFLFTLRPVPAKYQWVGIKQQRQNVALSHVHHSAELFMHGDEEMITIGGGDGQGIWLDHELQFGKTETCRTFDNPPLCATKDFEIKVVEVFGIEMTNS